MNRTLIARTALMAGGTLVSRLLGFARDLCMAWLLGGGAGADALVPALRLPYLARRLLGDGSFSMGLTAIFSRCASPIPQSDGEGRIASFCRLGAAVGLRLAAVLACALLLGELCAEPLVRVLAPGLAAHPATAAESAFLLRICLPYLLLAGAAALSMALLHSLHRFFLPSVSPAFFNLGVLICAGFAALRGSDPALLLALGVVTGGGLQCLAHGLALYRAGLRPNLARTPLSDSEARELKDGLRRLPAGLAGAAAPQLAVIGAGILASFLPAGSMAALYYAERLLEFPLGLAGAALGTAGLPALAALAVAGNTQELRKEAGEIVRLSLCLSLPAAAGLAAAALPIARLLFYRGAFDDQALAATAAAVCAYAPSLPAYAAGRSLLGVCNACGQMRVAAFSGLVAVPLAFVSGFLLLDYGIIAPPLGFSLGMWAQCLILWFGLRRRGLAPRVGPPSVARYTAGALLVLVLTHVMTERLPGSPASLMLTVCAAAALYFGFLILLGDELAPRLRKKQP